MERQVFAQRIDRIVELIAETAPAFYRASRNPEAPEKREVTLRVFETLKVAQTDILEARLQVERELRDATTAEKGRLNYQLLAFTELANSLLWALIGEDAFTTGLSADLPTHVGHLEFQNIQSCISAANKFNKDPNNFAFISDLASGANIGDLVRCEVDASGNLTITLVELKEGVVNKAIFDLHGLETDDPNKLPKALEAFENAFGEKGRKQLERVARQMKRAGKFLDLVTKDVAEDDRYGGTRFLQTLPTTEESHADLLNALLDDFYANRREFAWIRLDHVFYGFFALSLKNNQMHYQLDFRHYVYHDVGEGWQTCCFGDNPARKEMLAEMKTYSVLPMFELRDAVQMPFLRPLILTGLKPTYVQDVIVGRLGVLIHIDNPTLIGAMKAAGLDVFLTKSGHGRSDEGMYRIDGKFLTLRLRDKHATEMAIGNKAVFRTIFGFQTLPNFVQRLLDAVEDAKQRPAKGDR